MVALLHKLNMRGRTLGLAILCGGASVFFACAIEIM